MNKVLHTVKYIFFDLLSAGVAWTSFYIYRKSKIDPAKIGSVPDVFFDSQFFKSIIIIPLAWLLFYYLVGTYNNVLRRSRINELVQTFMVSLLGVTIVFFVLLLDDYVTNYKFYYKLFFTLFGLHFTFTAILRFILSSITNYRISKRDFGFRTIMIGSNERALSTFKEINSLKKGIGNTFLGFVHIEGKNGHSEDLKKDLPHLGEYHEIKIAFTNTVIGNT